MRSLAQSLVHVLILAAVYYLTAKAGLELAYPHVSTTIVWPPSGIALAALLLYGKYLWPGVFLGAFLINLSINLANFQGMAALSALAALGVACGNTLESVAGATLINRYAGGRNVFDRTLQVLKFVVFTGIFGATLAATCGVTSLCLSGLASWSHFRGMWLTWWLGDAIGMLILTPFLTAWSRRPAFRINVPVLIEAAGLSLAVFAASQISFGGWHFFPQKYPLSFVCLPVLMWAALRFGRQGATLTVLVLSVLAISGTLKGLGSFGMPGDRNLALLFIQTFLGTISLTVLILSSLILERDEAEKNRRIEAERALDSVEERFRLMIEEVRDYAIIMLDPKGHVVSWNKGAERIIGYEAGEVIGRHYSCFFPEEDLRNGKPEDELQIACARGRLEDEGWRLRKDGSRFWANVIVTALFEPSGKVRGFAKITRDVTERKLAEEKIVEKEKELREYIDHMSTMNAKVALDGSILLVNRLAEIGSGVPLEVLMKTHFLEGPWWAFDVQVQERVREAFHRALAGETVSYIEKVFVYDHVMDISFSLVPVRDGAGKIKYILAEGRDITALKQAEEALQRAREELEFRVAERTAELRRINDELLQEIARRKRVEWVLANQAQQLTRSNEELEQFAYIASHDLQEPLRMVASYTQLLERRYKDRLDTEAGKYIAYAVDGVSRMKELINDLLDYSRLNAPKKSFAPVSAREVFEKAADNLQVAIKEKKAKVTCETLPVVYGDFTQLVDLFQNLIGNGIKFNKSDPPAVRVSAKDQGSEVLFAVRDNGIGIESDYLDSIFLIFQRLHGRQEYGGTGIGLTICKKIVERHGGRIWVESEPGQGSCFNFTIPKGGPHNETS